MMGAVAVPGSRAISLLIEVMLIFFIRAIVVSLYLAIIVTGIMWTRW
jgi:hypothetical protein